MRAVNSLNKCADAVAKRLKKNGLQLTIGGEPSYVPIQPNGAEWNVTAIGPEKLKYAYALAAQLSTETKPGAFILWTPGKSYPGEVNPRWALHVVWNRDGSPLSQAPAATAAVPAKSGKSAKPKDPLSLQAKLRKSLLKRLNIGDNWLIGDEGVSAIPLDHDDKRWTSERWPFPDRRLELNWADGPAGLRLPLSQIPETAMRRALVLEPKPDGLHIFVPPFIQESFLQLIGKIQESVRETGIDRVIWEGYLPGDDADLWEKISLTPDPGVLEVNLPPCKTVRDYAWWIMELEKRTASVGLRSYKEISPEESIGTGGGNHIIFGGPSLEANPFFKNPAWITSILRYWQHHPCLSYFFTGNYVGSSSQAPRPDESSRALYDLEMAYWFLETLPQGTDQRYNLNETLRHLHTDASGNTHRSEISFDKFFNTAWAGGALGLIEFRAVETLPRAEWMAAVAVLWEAIAVMLFEEPFQKPLHDHGPHLQDRFFLPSLLWEDFTQILADLRRNGFSFDEELFRSIWNWRFPQMLAFEKGKAQLEIRRGCESWPLLCETPLEGGTTSRFVDTSMERLEFVANAPFVQSHRIFVQGRELKLERFPGGKFGCGLRYRRSALNPSLHPAIPPHMPLMVAVANGTKESLFKLEFQRRLFTPCNEAAPARATNPCRKMGAGLVTCDLRIP